MVVLVKCRCVEGGCGGCVGLGCRGVLVFVKGIYIRLTA